MERKLTLADGTEITPNGKYFIVAEIGQNHQGHLDTAKKLIQEAKNCGADCVKFQKTCIKEKFNASALIKLYESRNAFGKTYGEHKMHLEFSEKSFLELQAYANSIGILFAATAMDVESLKFLISMKMPFIKIGSGDVNNLILIEDAAKAKTPLIISTGMSNLNDVTKIYDCVKNYHENFALLHCVSAYPTPANRVNLRVLKIFEEKFPDVIIGYSGHEEGTNISLAAAALGAKIIERHITIDKTWPGSDHSSSLTPTEFTELVKKIRELEIALGEPIKSIYECELSTLIKLRKMIVARRFISAGETLQREDLAIKVVDPPYGIDGKFLDKAIGKKIKNDLNADQPLLELHLEQTDEKLMATYL